MERFRKQTADTYQLRFGAQDHQRHIIILLGTGDESIRRLHDASNDLRRHQPAALLHGSDQLRLAPLLVGRVHGFADAVRGHDGNT